MLFTGTVELGFPSSANKKQCLSPVSFSLTMLAQASDVFSKIFLSTVPLQAGQSAHFEEVLFLGWRVCVQCLSAELERNTGECTLSAAAPSQRQRTRKRRKTPKFFDNAHGSLHLSLKPMLACRLRRDICGTQVVLAAPGIPPVRVGFLTLRHNTDKPTKSKGGRAGGEKKAWRRHCKLPHDYLL